MGQMNGFVLHSRRTLSHALGHVCARVLSLVANNHHQRAVSTRAPIHGMSPGGAQHCIAGFSGTHNAKLSWLVLG